MNSHALLVEWAERLESGLPGYEFPGNGAEQIDPDLARTVRFVLALMLDVLKERRGSQFAQRIVRALEQGEFPDMSGDPGDLDRVSATYRMLLSILGLAEGYHQFRRFEQSGLGLGRTLESLRDTGVSAGQLEDALERMEIRLVATAHPTNIFRRIVLGARREIFHLIRKLNEPVADAADFTRLVERLRERLVVNSATRFGRWEKPEVLDEVRQVIGYFRNTIYETAPEVEARLNAELRQIFGSSARGSSHPLLRFGSWVGGDMDGNPFVNPDVYRRAIELQRRAAMELFSERLARTSPTVSMALSPDFQVEPLLDSIRADLAAMRESRLDAHSLERFLEREPFRLKLELIRMKVDRAVARRFEEAPERGQRGFRYHLPEEALADLEILADALQANGFAATAREAIDPLRRRLEMFGFHLCSLDLREDSLHIGRAARLALKIAGHDVDPAADAAPDTDREGYVKLLTQEILNPRRIDVRRLFPGDENNGAGEDPAELFASRDDYEHVHRIYTMLEAARYAQRFAGERCTSNLILTMTSCMEDLLHALLLLKNAGLFFRKLDGTWAATIDIVPLFETIGDLEGAEGIMRSVLDNEAYRAQLDARGRSQLMMLGFSDSNKDGGYFASNWYIYQAQRRLLTVTEEHSVQARFFYGRGGSIGRGGASSRHVANSLPPGAIRNGYDLTEQGEVLSRYYLADEVARVHLETILSAAIEKNARPEPQPASEFIAAAEELARLSRADYRRLVHDNPHLVPYFEECTPREVELVKIGSRPVRRRAMSTIADLRAIPWVFRWFQSRQFIPGWYGLGAGLTTMQDRPEYGSAFIQKMYQEWKFFRAIVENSSLALFQSDRRIAGLYRDLAEDPEAARAFFAEIESEWEKCENRLGTDLDFAPRSSFQREFPVLLASQKLKQPWVATLGTLQVDLLKRYRSLQTNEPENQAAQELVREAVISSIEGVALGLGATG